MKDLRRKIETPIREFLCKQSDRILLVEGARQVGKSYTIRKVANELFANVIEINMAEDKNGPRLFENINTVENFYLRLSIAHGDKMMGDKSETIVFIDEIQEYPALLTLLKFLNQDSRFRYVASGSLLGVTLTNSVSIPVGSLKIIDMFPLDFEEFLWSNNVSDEAVESVRKSIENIAEIDSAVHNRLMELWKLYLVIGGLPAVVKNFLAEKNFAEVRSIQNDIRRLYVADAIKYEKQHALLISRIYDLIPSNMENKKKRIVARDIENQEGARFTKYAEEFEYLISSGIALETMAVSNPRFPLSETVSKNLMKLYLNDPGLLTSALYGPNVQAILDDILSVNLGSVYETAVACQLKSNGRRLFYFDNKKKGEVDFLVNDYTNQTILPIEVKSGKDYTVHSAITRLLSDAEYGIKKGIVLSNSGRLSVEKGISYLPVYYSMFL